MHPHHGSTLHRTRSRARSFAARHRRLTVTLGVVLALLVGVNVIAKFGPPRTGLVIGPTVAIGMILIARRAGLTWDDLGLARSSWRRGATYALAAVAVVAAVYAVGAALPDTRAAFLDARYRLPPAHALLTALVVVPLGTVLLEEVAFRGVLLGLMRRHRSTAWASAISSALFGLWHVLPSLRLGSANSAVAAVVGVGPAAQVVVVSGVVIFTAVSGIVFCELRRRSGSLLASAGLHWATNGLGVLLAAVLWSLRAG